MNECLNGMYYVVCTLFIPTSVVRSILSVHGFKLLGNVRVLYSYYLFEAKWPLSDKLRINWLKSYSS